MSSTDSSATILVVDDDRLSRLVTSRFLRKAGFDVIEAADGETALTRVAESKPSLLLLDIVMPGLDGYMVCERLRDDPATAYIPVIFLSCLGAEPDKARARSRPAPSATS
ncbi:MAG: response regulator [Deltaproteobacteria bacterium]|nr:response regulator [Deltaproteobacteria bacterium]